MAGPGRVLVAEDDDVIRNLISRVLQRCDVPHDAVRDGRLAIEHLEAREYAAVLVDLMMPVVDGYAVLDYLRDHPRRPASVLIVTAASEADLHRLDPGLPMTIIRKPFDVHELTSVARQAAFGDS
jgi:CheY-like chemotaxis protein